jgi:hypothetical protein
VSEIWCFRDENEVVLFFFFLSFFWESGFMYPLSGVWRYDLFLGILSSDD